VVIGIGLNVRPVGSISNELLKEGGAAPAAALDDLLAGRRLGRSAIVAALLNALHTSLVSFGAGGLPGILAAWRRHDWLAGQRVSVTQGREAFHGIAHGIGDDGALLVERNGTIVPVVAGDVTLRAS
jgi:BirA family biotin operon repressor/biotin-[acetyl-CoA-carboxylase] ligase